MFRRAIRATVFAGWLSMSSFSVLADQPSTTLKQQAQQFNEHSLLLDSHMDIALHLARPDWDILKQHDYASDFSQVGFTPPAKRRFKRRLLGGVHPAGGA